MALNGVYRFLYFYLIKKVPIKDVPSGLEDDVFDLKNVELGKYALQLPPPSDKLPPPTNVFNAKVAPEPADEDGAFTKISRDSSVELHEIELQPLIKKYIDSRFENMEGQHADSNARFDARFDALEAKLSALTARNSPPN
jgi:hypothetical protein